MGWIMKTRHRKTGSEIPTAGLAASLGKKGRAWPFVFINPMITRHRQSVVYESINATTVGALPTQPLASILRNAAAPTPSKARAPFHNPLVQRRLWNYEPRGTIFFLAPDVEDMIKECKFEGHPGPIGPVFHAQIHIKGSQARLLKAYGVWSKRSPLCEFYFILVVHIMFQSNHHKSHA